MVESEVASPVAVLFHGAGLGHIRHADKINLFSCTLHWSSRDACGVINLDLVMVAGTRFRR